MSTPRSPARANRKAPIVRARSFNHSGRFGLFRDLLFASADDWFAPAQSECATDLKDGTFQVSVTRTAARTPLAPRSPTTAATAPTRARSLEDISASEVSSSSSEAGLPGPFNVHLTPTTASVFDGNSSASDLSRVKTSEQGDLVGIERRVTEEGERRGGIDRRVTAEDEGSSSSDGGSAPKLEDVALRRSPETGPTTATVPPFGAKDARTETLTLRAPEPALQVLPLSKAVAALDLAASSGNGNGGGGGGGSSASANNLFGLEPDADATVVRQCFECGKNMEGSTVYMLHDVAYCSSDCRLTACRREARQGGSETPSLQSTPKAPRRMLSNVSCQSMTSSASSTGLAAMYPSWI